MADTPAVFTELKLTGQIRELVDKALDRGRPLLITYVGEDGKPNISFRGSAQVHSDNQLAIWVRTARTGLAAAVAKNPSVVMFYSDDILNPAVRAMITFKGRAWVDNKPETLHQVYENSPVLEQKRDPERKGTALIIDLDSVSGMAPGAQFRMTRA